MHRPVISLTETNRESEMGSAMPFWKLGDLCVWVDPATTPSKARALLVHGLGEHSGRFKNLFTHLNENAIDVVRFDLRGSGSSEGKRMWIEKFDDYVDDLTSVAREVVSKLPPLPTFLFGHSLGGAIALNYAARKSHELKGLILSAPAFRPGVGVSPLKVAVGRKLVKFLPSMRMPGTLDILALSRDPRVAADYANDPLNCSFNTLNQGNEILNALDEMPARAAEVKIPVLIVHGDSDRIIKVEGSRELLEKFATKDKTLVAFPGGYHEPHNDTNKEEALSTISGWILKHAISAG